MKLEILHCPSCGAEFNDVVGSNRIMEAGDYIVCTYCISACIWEINNADVRLRKPESELELDCGVEAQREFILFCLSHPDQPDQGTTEGNENGESEDRRNCDCEDREYGDSAGPN